MTNTPITVVDEYGKTVTVLCDDYSIGFASPDNLSTILHAADSSTNVTWASPLANIPTGDFLLITSAVNQGIFKANQQFAINKDLVSKVVARTGGGSSILFKRIWGALSVTDSKASIDAQLQDTSGGSGTFNTLSGDVVSTSTGGATTIQPNVVTNAKAAQMPANTIKGNNTGATANQKDLTVAETKAMLSLNNVDNTSDANKPISTATQTALNAKQDTLVSGTNIKTINGSSIVGSGNLVVGGGSSLSEYGVSVSGSAGILVRFYATAGITVAKTNSSTLTFTIPASGFIQSFDIYYPSAENAGATTTLVFNYTSNTTTNQGFSTAKVAYIYAMTGTRVVSTRNNAADIIVDATASGGNITHVLTNPSSIQTGDIKLFGSFV